MGSRSVGRQTSRMGTKERTGLLFPSPLTFSRWCWLAERGGRTDAPLVEVVEVGEEGGVVQGASRVAVSNRIPLHQTDPSPHASVQDVLGGEEGTCRPSREPTTSRGG